MAVLLGAGGAAGLPLPALSLGLRELLLLLVALMALRGLLQVGIAVLQEWLNSALTDRLRCRADSKCVTGALASAASMS